MATKKGPSEKPRKRRGDYVGFRSSKGLKAKLEEAARVNNRSLSTEAQIRLEQSFFGEEISADVLQKVREAAADIIATSGLSKRR